MDLNKIREIKARNLAAMEKENAEKAARLAEEKAAEERRNSPEAKAASAAMMVQLVDMVSSPRLGGRPLTNGQLARLKEIRLRNLIMSNVAAAQKETK